SETRRESVPGGSGPPSLAANGLGTRRAASRSRYLAAKLRLALSNVAGDVKAVAAPPMYGALADVGRSMSRNESNHHIARRCRRRIGSVQASAREALHRPHGGCDARRKSVR